MPTHIQITSVSEAGETTGLLIPALLKNAPRLALPQAAHACSASVFDAVSGRPIALPLHTEG